MCAWTSWRESYFSSCQMIEIFLMNGQQDTTYNDCRNDRIQKTTCWMKRRWWTAFDLLSKSTWMTRQSLCELRKSLRLQIWNVEWRQRALLDTRGIHERLIDTSTILSIAICPPASQNIQDGKVSTAPCIAVNNGLLHPASRNGSAWVVIRSGCMG